MNMTKSDIVVLLRARRFAIRKISKIFTDKIDAISYQDLLELYLFTSGVRRWKWCDFSGRVSSPQSLIRIIANLIRDVLFWPFIYGIYFIKTSLLNKQICKRLTLNMPNQKFNSVLFLRTDHWFNVKSGGSVGHLSGVINGLRTLGKYVQVVSSDYLAGVEKKADFLLCRPVYNLGRNLPNMPELIYNKQLIHFLDSRFKNDYPSLVYQRYSLGNYVGVYLKAQYKVPYICEYNGSFPWMARHWNEDKLIHEKLISKIELLNLNAADVVVVVSQAMKDELIDRGIEAGKVLVNPNGVDPERYSPDVNGTQIRDKNGFYDGHIVIGFIGTFGQWHGAEILSEAYGMLLQQFPDYRQSIRLFMIGDGPTMSKIKENLKKFSVEDVCVLTGLIPQEDGPAYLAACDILASPHVPNPDGSPFFGSPTKLFEYMAMGKSIIASDLDQIGEILTHNVTAWMVRPGDSKSLMSGLKFLIENPKLRDTLGKKARRTVLQHYTWHIHTQKIIEKFRGYCA
jgi:glycosyltransferase involved in cell wall biosynthesis